MGRPFFPWSNGKLMLGIPQNVQMVENIGSPVEAKPFGASPFAEGVNTAS